MLIASPTGSGKTSAVIKMIEAHLNAGHLCDQQKDDALSVQKDYIKASKGLDVPAELLDSISLGRTSSPLPIKNLLRQRISIKAKIPSHT